MNPQQRLLFNTQCGLYISALLVLSRFVLGVMGNLQLIGTAFYTSAILLAKRQCVLGLKKRGDFPQRNKKMFVFLFLSSLLYLTFVICTFFYGRTTENSSFVQAVLTAFISFTELILALLSLFRLTDDHYCFNIKVMNVCIAFIAIRSTQIALLDYNATPNTEFPNMMFGIAVGIAVMICSVALLLRPRYSVMGREYNQFKASDQLDDKYGGTMPMEVTIVKSKVYGSYVYKAQLTEGIVSGNIVRLPSVWSRLHVAIKVLCIVLSEILVFVWLAGRLVYMFRTVNLNDKLADLMYNIGFEKIADGDVS